MTLLEFINSVCKEVFTEENLLKVDSKPSHSNQYKKPKSSVLITEEKLKKMIKDGSISELSEDSRFTPLAHDSYRDYNKKLKA